MFHQEQWFAWLPVKVRARGGQRWAWLETVMRERAQTTRGNGAWRYYAID